MGNVVRSLTFGAELLQVEISVPILLIFLSHHPFVMRNNRIMNQMLKEPQII